MAESVASRGRFSLVSVRPLPEALINHVRAYLGEQARDVAESEPASRGLFTRTWIFTHDDVESLRLELRTPAMAMAIDSALMSGEMAVHGPRLITSDVDQTFFQDEVIELVAQRAGTAELVAAITQQAMEGHLDFAESLHQRVATVKGQNEYVLDDVRNQVRLSEGARELVTTAHAHGAKVGLVSGGYTQVLGPIADDVGADFMIANTFEIEDGRLTGRVTGPVIDGAAKVDALERWSSELGIDPSQALAVGDGANDLPMIHRSGLGVSYMGKPIVVEQADAAISFPRLDALCALVGWDVK